MTRHPRLPGRLTDRLAVADAQWRSVESRVGFENAYLALTVDTIAGPDGEPHDRVVVRPRAAVAVAAIDEAGRIALVEQYRHPMGRRMLEIPAGLMDVAGESPRQTAERELAEEVDLIADDWRELVQIAPTPGYSTEVISIFRASSLRPLPAESRTEREAEERDLTHWWVDLGEAAAACADGRIQDAKTMIAIWAAARA